MTTRDQKMQALVKDEARELRNSAYKYELKRLDFDTLLSTNSVSCIYGQMTSSCFSDRAHGLIFKCCNRIYDFNVAICDAKLNGKPTLEGRYDRKYWSPIEVFIDTPMNQENGNNERLVKYLKGETETLIFE